MIIPRGWLNKIIQFETSYSYVLFIVGSIHSYAILLGIIGIMVYPQNSFINTEIDSDCLLGRRCEVVLKHTLLYQLDVLKSTGRYDAFKLKWHPIYDEEPLAAAVPKHLFWDSDVGKWIEGACYYLAQHSLPDIDAAVKDLVEMISHAQQDDGYLNIHYMVVAPGKRWTNLKDMHELSVYRPSPACPFQQSIGEADRKPDTTLDIS